MNFVRRVQATPVLSTATGAVDRTSTVVDTRGSHGVAIAVHFGAVAAGGTVKLQGGHLADGSDMADLAGTSAAYLGVDANAVFILEVGHSQFRYLRLVVDKSGGGDSTESAVAYLHSTNTEPVTQPVDVYAVHHHAPAAGAA